MTKRCYIPRNFKPKSLEIIANAEKIIREYEAQGFSLTLRQLYYQFVARGLLENRDANYTRLGDIISNARLAGLISWTAIEDRTRNLRGVQTFDGPEEPLRQAQESYRRDLWLDQPMRPEVWIEKDALVGVIEQICVDLRVDFFACRGYNSQSEQWRGGRRFAGYVQRGQHPIVFHLGDHDPSGLDMTRDNRERLSLFAGVPIAVQRLALNMDQIEEHRPPPNPAKMTDSRFADYQQRYGTDTSWELDALPPNVIAGLIADVVAQVRDEALWEEALQREVDDKRRMDDLIETLSYKEGEG